MELRTTGIHVRGTGEAHRWAQTRRDRYVETFGCPLFGTFNVRIDREFPFDDIENAVVAWPEKPGDPRQYYHVVELQNDQAERRRGWFVRWWNGRSWRPNKNLLEIYTKELLPDSFRHGTLEVLIPKRLTGPEIKEWSKDLYWFQGFPWLVHPRAESAMLWDFLGNDNWSGKQVFDFGCHHGFHSFEAARRGAVVVGFDTDPDVIHRAKFIGNHIEGSDARFMTGAVQTGKPWAGTGTADIALCLSVLHQMDPSYVELAHWLDILKTTAPVIWLELINPPLKGVLSQETINDIVGVQPVLRYKHRVRCWRNLYRLGES